MIPIFFENPRLLNIENTNKYGLHLSLVYYLHKYIFVQDVMEVFKYNLKKECDEKLFMTCSVRKENNSGSKINRYNHYQHRKQCIGNFFLDE